jgi:hypothetical protein
MKQTSKTSVKPKSLDPSWHEYLLFELEPLQPLQPLGAGRVRGAGAGRLQLEVFDHNKLSRDQSLGKVEIGFDVELEGETALVRVRSLSRFHAASVSQDQATASIVHTASISGHIGLDSMQPHRCRCGLILMLSTPISMLCMHRYR